MSQLLALSQTALDRVEFIPFISGHQRHLLSLFKDAGEIALTGDSMDEVWDFAISPLHVKKLRVRSKFIIPSIVPTAEGPQGE